MTNSNKEGKQFCVVQFTEAPLRSIDDHVCVPYSWVILQRFKEQKAIVVYPEDEDPFETRARARRNERYVDNWKTYRATIKYESDSYSDAEHWIATRNNYGPIKAEEEDTDSIDPEPERELDRKLRSTTQYPTSNFSSDKNKVIVKPYGNSRKPMIKMSIKRPIQSEPKNDLSEKQPKIVKTAESNRVTTSTSIRPGSSKRKQPIIVRDDALISAEIKESAATSNSEKSTEKTIESHHAGEDKPFVQPGPSNSLQPTSSTLSGKKQSSPIYQDCEKDSQSKLHTELPYLTINGKSYQDFKPREIREERSTEVTGDDENPHHHTITNKTPSISHYLLNSMNLSTEICNFKRAELLSNINDNSVANNSLRSANQSSSLPMRSMESQAHLVSQNQQEVLRVQEMHDRRLIERNSSNQRFLPRSSSSSSRTDLNTQNTQIRRSSEEKYHRTCHQGITNKMSAAQIDCSIQQPDEQQYLPTQENNSQQILQVRDTVKIPTQNRGIDHSALYDEFTKQILAMQNKPNPANQPSCSLFRNENQRIQVDQDYLQNERLTEEKLRRSTESLHTDHRPHPQNVRMNIPFTAQNSLNVINQFDNNPELLQQRRLNHQKPQQDPKMPKIRIGVTIKTKNDSHQPQLQGVIRRTPPLPVFPKDSNIMRQSFLNTQRNYPIRDPRIQARLNVFTEQNNNARAAYPQNIMVEPSVVRQNFEVQPTSSSTRFHETQHKQVHDNQVYQNPRTFKMVVNQSTETNATTKHVHFDDNIVRSPPIESSSVVMNSMCQTDENFSVESLSPDRALVSDHKVVKPHEVVSDYKMSTEETPVEIKNDAGSPKERIPPGSDSSVRPIADQPTTSSNQVHPRIVIEQKMLYEFASLFNQMGTTMSQTSDMYKRLHSSIHDSVQIYDRLIEAVHVFNALGNFLNTATPSCLMSESSHITEKRQAGEENLQSPKLNQGHRRTFVLPPEYDPNDSKWTLKYQRSMPGLVELMPQSDIYVSCSQLEYFKRTSRDCKTLAQMLLTEVFSMSALSVCSLTGRANALDDVDNVRPGLDGWARMVLLKFVEKFGLQCAWIVDTLGIIISMRDKIDEIRAKYSQRSRF